MQIAIVSTDGVHVNDHFGRAQRFLVYSVQPEKLMLLASRNSPPYSLDNPTHGFDAIRFETLLTVLAGCSRIYCTKIGERPKAELAKAGIQTIIYEGPISDIRI